MGFLCWCRQPCANSGISALHTIAWLVLICMWLDSCILVNPAPRAKVQREKVKSLNQKTPARLNLNEILLGSS